MLFGESIMYPEAEGMLSLARDNGINTFDAAEMYPVPQKEQTQGLSESYLGRWLKLQKRETVQVATKATGPSGEMTWIRGGPSALDSRNILAAIEDSLLRLQSDYIDLYQLHWPDRYVPMFGEVQYRQERAYSSVPLEEQLEAVSQAVRQGKVRCFGVSNETPWGVMQFLHLWKTKPGLPKVETIQNAYSLTCRTFEEGLAEICSLEGVQLLAYSPLAMGLLTGKYLEEGGGPPDARLNKYKGRYAEAESRYGPKPNVRSAVEAYAQLARQNGISPLSLAIRFVLSKPFVSTAVLGASSAEQLVEQLEAATAGPLPSELLDAIDVIHQRYPNPTP
eukprot:jgi/Botrbrau1/23516/Bobra.106_1s0066.2